MILDNKCNLKEKIIRANGGGIAVVIWGVTVMLVFIFASINILNAKLIEEEYNRLRDSVQSAATGSVIHLLYGEEQASDIRDGGNSKIKFEYDAYLQLALGYIINYGSDDLYNPNEDSTTISIEENNFIKLDHRKVVNSTMELIFDTVLPHAIRTDNNYQILMLFIEPIYDDNYQKGFNIIRYTNREGSNTGRIYYVHPKPNTMTSLYGDLEDKINYIVNEPFIEGGTSTNWVINLNAGSNKTNDELIQDMRTNPYYLIVVKNFALPTIFTGGTTQNENIFTSIFTSISGDGTLNRPIAVLQAGNVERKEADI